MPKRLLALVLGLLTLLLAAATTATAADPPAVQTVDQSAASGQQATAASGATQVNPTNTNIAVRVLSPGDDGDVTQTNAVDSTAVAANENETGQLAGQAQTGSGGIQTADQSAGNLQLAGAFSTAAQYGATNTNLPVRVGSPGDGGKVTQTNAVDSTAAAANENETGQAAGQVQAGGGACCHAGGTGVQTADQSASNAQAATAKSEAKQVHPENVNISVRVLSPGDDGKVTQTNAVDSKAVATNDNDTKQAVLQGDKGGDCKCGGGPSIQTADQSSKSVQGATAVSAAKQDGAKNVNLAIRVGSKGDGGDVKQANIVGSTAIAANDNDTKQLAGQSQADGGRPDKRDDCKCDGGASIQTADQSSKSLQGAAAFSVAKQEDAKNVNMPIRVGSKGDDGDVKQANIVGSTAIATNDNDTKQLAGQSQADKSRDCKCDGGASIQTADQSSFNLQGAKAFSAAEQDDAKNVNKPIRVGSKGDGGDVKQANAVGSTAIAANDNKTLQLLGQSQADKGHAGKGHPDRGYPDKGHDDKRDDCKCDGGASIQTADQSSKSLQGATAFSVAKQEDAENVNKPIRVGSKGDDGDVEQANIVGSTAIAANDNKTLQLAGQKQAGGAGIGVQTSDQDAFNGQLATAASGAFQSGASNDNSPIRVGSKGDGGSVKQLNAVDSEAKALNANATFQLADQDQLGKHDCKCGAGIGIQALGQKAVNAQAADAKSAAVQDFGKKSKCGCHEDGNSNSPVRVGSKGDDGHVRQANTVSSTAAAANLNGTLQAAGQKQLGTGGIAIQALGQEAKSLQAAEALSLALQLGASNASSPVRVGSKGDGGSVAQANVVESDALAANANGTKQLAGQAQLAPRHCGCAPIAIQALGQSAFNLQAAKALSAAFQLKPENTNAPTSVWSYGDAGSLLQLNTADSSAAGLNGNETAQLAGQLQA